jgi:hypothetical protein
MLVICGTVPLAANCKSPNAQPSSQSAAQAAKESSPQTATPNPCKGFDPLTDPDNLELRSQSRDTPKTIRSRRRWITLMKGHVAIQSERRSHR